MTYEQIKANLNLYAVLKNLEDVVKYDQETASLAKDWRLSIQFSVKNGPAASVAFKNGVCTVERGKCKGPSVRLYFKSAEHLNKMMDGKANPIPLKGFTKLGFLTKEFPKATDRLEYFLKPNDELLKDPAYLSINTRLTLSTAAHAARELCLHDEVGKLNAAHIPDGTVLFKILPDGAAVHMIFRSGEIDVIKGEVAKPSAMMLFRNEKVANDLLNGKLDAFAAIAAGDVMIRGRVPMVDALNQVLDRIGHYLT